MAVSEGVVPKARRPFALFLQDHAKIKPGASRQEFANEMKQLGLEWKSLAAKEKQVYKSKSDDEFAAQRQAMKISGLPVRGCYLRSKAPTEKSQDEDNKLVETSKFGAFTVLQDQNKEENWHLGEGSYGSVLLASDRDGRKCALKIFKNKHASESFAHEASILSILQKKLQPIERLWFPYLLKQESKRRPFPFLALEYCGPSLAAALQSSPLDNECVTAISLQLKASLLAIHRVGVLHLDVKPANILWHPVLAVLKLTDFGMADRMDEPSMRLPEYVTPMYRPPELWDANTVDLRKSFMPAVDVWSYGCVIYECATAFPLMGPLHKNGSSRHVVQVWCRDFHRIKDAAAPSSKNDAFRMQVRLQRAGAMSRFFLPCLHPDAAVRRWGQWESKAEVYRYI